MRTDQPMLHGAAAKAAYLIERWKRGLIIIIMIGCIVVGAALAVAIPLGIISELLGLPGLASNGNIALATGFVSLPYMLTHREAAEILRRLLDTKTREN